MFADNSDLRRRVMSLIGLEYAMVISTLDKLEKTPWSAVVYFLYNDGLFYFVSSPKSRHITQAKEANIASASIFVHAKSLSDIQGLQMLGNVINITSIKSAREIIKKYFTKFRFAKNLFSFNQKGHGDTHFFEKFKVKLYGFKPSKIIYSDNYFGFAFRKEINFSEYQ